MCVKTAINVQAACTVHCTYHLSFM